MGENEPNSIRRLSTIKYHRLTDAMVSALETGRPSNGTANVLGRTGTIVALIQRGLVTAGPTNQWTKLGYQVAAAVLSGPVPTWAEGHPETAALRAAPGPVVEVLGKQWPSEAELAANVKALNDEGNPDRPLRADTPLAESLVAADWAEAEAEEAVRVRTWAAEIVNGAEVPLGEPRETMISRGALDDLRAEAIKVAPARRSKTCCATTEGDVHACDCQTPAARKQWGPMALRTQSERAPEAAPAYFAPGDFVTIDGADARMWRVKRIADFGDEETGRELWATLAHVAGTLTSVPLTRLKHVPPVEIAADSKPATSQTATSQIDYAALADAIRSAAERIAEGARAAAFPVDTQVPVPLHKRMIKRAQYEALRKVYDLLDGSVMDARKNCVANGHGDAARHDDGVLCGERFDAGDICDLLASAARELGIRWSA